MFVRNQKFFRHQTDQLAQNSSDILASEPLENIISQILSHGK